MPTTTLGTTYTTRTRTLDGVGKTAFHCPDAKLNDPTAKACILFHGAGGAFDQMASLPAFKPMFEMFMDNGWPVIEGDPLPTTDFAGNVREGGQWGNDQSVAAYPTFHDSWADDYPGAETVGALFGRSMGELAALRIAVQNPNYAEAAIINNSGVSTWFVGNNTAPTNGSTPPQLERSSARFFSGTDNPPPTGFRASAMAGAWGTETFEAFQAALIAADAIPEAWDPTRLAGRKIAFQYGTADPTVPWTPRGGSSLSAAWAGQLAINRVAPLEGGTHGAGGALASYSQVTEVRDFLYEVYGITPEPEVRTYNRIVGRGTIIDGAVHLMTTKE